MNLISVYILMTLLVMAALTAGKIKRDRRISSKEAGIFAMKAIAWLPDLLRMSYKGPNSE